MFQRRTVIGRMRLHYMTNAVNHAAAAMNAYIAFSSTHFWADCKKVLKKVGDCSGNGL